ncbi:MAG TPA: CRISPR-associated helicase Cas3' [Methanothrix sp.]|nr:CRISPR-associated helicase Cas3' [Methanothrix sp.]
MESQARELPSYELKSHPNKRLIDHLQQVGDLCWNTIEEKSLNVDEADLLKDGAYIIGITHDLGKATSFFQKYILETDEKKKKFLKAKPTTHHGLLSAFFTYAVMREYLRQTGRKGGLADYLPILSFLAVKRHHGNLQNAMDEIKEIDSDKERILKLAKEQIDSMADRKEEIRVLLPKLLARKEINIDINIDTTINYILNDAIKEIRRKEKSFIRGLSESSSLYPYFISQFIYSALLDADKTDAGLGGANLGRLDLSSKLVDEYRDAKGFSTNKININDLRNQIYQEAVERIEGWDLNEKILSLNVPTGTGKTLAVLSLSLKLKDRLQRERNINPRIIYALPFLSIIDQNYRVFEDVILKPNNSQDSRMLLKHHHLADAKFKIEENEYEADKSLLLLEGWNAEIIVTTFWQLFSTLFSNRNRQLRKFSKLANSIIILDEVQAVPHQYWLLIHDSLKLLAEKFNSYVVFMTATQPLIFDESKGEIKEIAQKKDEYFRRLNRIKLIPRIEKSMTMDEFKALLEKELIEKSNKDFLIVLNTINSAQEIYRFIQNMSLENTKSIFLSTNVIPKVRLARIDDIRKSRDSSKERKVIVSTQLIEAGVDIDADIVYRDFAPLDCINQVAGRCNRNSSKRENGIVSIFILKDKRKEFYKYIYDPFLISKTLDILPKNGSIRESEFLDLNKSYFNAVKRGMSDTDSKEILECISGLAFKDLSTRFKLIEDDYPRVDVFIELDERAKEIWSQFRDLQKENDHLERTKKYLKIKKDFSEYVIAAPEKFAHNLVIEEFGIGYISKDELPNYYDHETGFMRAGAGEGSMII